jgi:hypothetical protein
MVSAGVALVRVIDFVYYHGLKAIIYSTGTSANMQEAL